MKLEQKLKHALKSNKEALIHEVFEDIYNEYNKLVCFIIKRYVKNNEDVKDLTQDTFISFYNNLNDNMYDIKSYLVVSAKNKSLNFLKSQNVVINDDEYIYNIYSKEEINSEYKEIIEKMSEYLTQFEIEIILQHTINDLSFKEISEKFNRNINTVLSLYNRALKKFKKGVKK